MGVSGFRHVEGSNVGGRKANKVTEMVTKQSLCHQKLCKGQETVSGWPWLV